MTTTDAPAELVEALARDIHRHFVTHEGVLAAAAPGGGRDHGHARPWKNLPESVQEAYRAVARGLLADGWVPPNTRKWKNRK